MRRAVISVCFACWTIMAEAAPAVGPTVHVLGPGFDVEELPVGLTNVNGLAFAPDGRLYAVGYDGRVRLLVDSDGDGLEDRAETFWGRDTLISPIAGVWAPEGLYVSSHRKVSLLKDTDGDGEADVEEVVASGWPKIPSGSGLVDAMGITLDPAGNLYVALGCADFTNPYLIADGEAHYRRTDELGTILKISKDRTSRAIYSTGLRFAYGLEFNGAGDLFATEQEGETWLQGANPLDELDHIQPGRHYGWPPRHDQHLPDTDDEPPIVGFSPQHQSACGLDFDGIKHGWKTFGPESWQGDGFVTGFSRGKLWRVRLSKTPAGYVGEPTLFAAVDMMVSDVAISPSGALYLSCHSGEPDWGTGPQGPGRLFRITHQDPSAPQAVASWAAGPLEVRVTFDRPVDPAILEGLAGSTIPYGESVRAADALEAFKPPYKAVEEQQAAPRGTLRIAAARLDDGGRTLALVTDPHPREASYALNLPRVRAPGARGTGATVNLDYDLSGVEASWTADGQEQPSWSVWWPHLDPDVVRDLARGSAPHEAALGALDRPGLLALRTMIRLPEGKSTLLLDASGPIEAASLMGEDPEVSETAGRHQASWRVESDGQPADLLVEVRTGERGKPLSLRATAHSERFPTDRPVPTGRLVLPWAPAPPPASATPPGPPPTLAGADPKRGEEIFFGAEAKCSNCHLFRGRGGVIGPDLTNLPGRDAASVYRDIADPSATIHPDYLPFTVGLTDGRVLVGVVRAEGADAIRVLDTNAQATVVSRSEVEELRPSSTSIMPVGLVGAIGEARIKDLMAYLMTPAPAGE